MILGSLDHFTILTSPARLPALEAFYRETIGLVAGTRPDFPFPGRWLYNGERAVLHVVATLPDDAAPASRGECIEHVAFKATGAAAFRARLDRMEIPYTDAKRPLAGYQIFLRDPAGVRVEFNFDIGDAPGG
jgi:catechol 2,3-dioxygenase-like lactoylglutathione lyase family enzyme